MKKNCAMGVGCDETGICYAEANGQPCRCEAFEDFVLEQTARDADDLSPGVAEAINALITRRKLLRHYALAAAASGGDVQQAPGEAPQSGPNESEGNAQNTPQTPPHSVNQRG